MIASLKGGISLPLRTCGLDHTTLGDSYPRSFLVLRGDPATAFRVKEITGAEHLLRSTGPRVGSLRRHSVDRRSSNWGDALLPPTARDLGRLARQARTAKPEQAVNPPTAVARSLRRRLTPEVRQSIIARYEAGESAKALSHAFGISRDGVRRVLAGEEVPIRTQFRATPEAVGQIIELYEGGLTIRQVAAQVGCAYGTVRGVLHEIGADVRVSPVGKRSAPDE